MHVSTVVCYSIHKSIGMNVRIKTMAFWLNRRRLSNAQNRDGDQAKPNIRANGVCTAHAQSASGSRAFPMDSIYNRQVSPVNESARECIICNRSQVNMHASVFTWNLLHRSELSIVAFYFHVLLFLALFSECFRTICYFEMVLCLSFSLD